MPEVSDQVSTRMVLVLGGNNAMVGVSTVGLQAAFGDRFVKLGAGDGCMGTMVSGTGRRFGFYAPLDRRVTSEKAYRAALIVSSGCVFQIFILIVSLLRKVIIIIFGM
jgi:hypothetical protein